ncbi:MAG: NADH-quinone oxidoreductase subunit NuoE [Proteobacteria bacterium]|nr:NADH-quinone oxidoreductase subunit NuoE [Pseudomonadota bacterium]
MTLKSFSFDDYNLKKADAYLKKYPKGKEQSAIKALLDLAQRQNDGWLSKECIEYVATFLDIPFIKAMEIASFYTMFNLKPVGKFHVKVCCTTPCWLNGADDIKEKILKYLNVDLDEITNDGLITVSEVECLGACVNGPVMQINDDFFEDLDEASALLLIQKIKENKPIQSGSAVGRQCSKAYSQE